MTLLKVKNVFKQYGAHLVLEAADLEINEGEIVGLVGRNGCGKTTLMKLILGLASPTKGEIKTTDNVKFGFLLDCKVFEFLSGAENLKLIGSYSSVSPSLTRINELLDFVGLSNDNRKVRDYSFGMKQRLSLALALLEEPNFLILDEPFVGLDPVGTQNFIEYIRKLRSELGVTVLVSSHQLSEIEEICDYFFVIKDRKLYRYSEISQSTLRIFLADISSDVRTSLEKLAVVKQNSVLIANDDKKLSDLGALFCLNFLPLLYGMGAYFNWKIVSIGARLDLITFITSMWSFTVMLTIPLILLLFITAATLGGEINEGQMLLEVTRVKDKKVLLIGKALAILGMTLLFYVVNVICSSCAYIFFLSKTSNGYSEIFTTHAYNVESSLISLASLLFILFLLMVTFYLSVNLSLVMSTLSGMGMYLLCMLLGYVPKLSSFVPGYFTVVANYKFTLPRILIQYIELLMLIVGIICWTIKKFEKREY